MAILATRNPREYYVKIRWNGMVRVPGEDGRSTGKHKPAEKGVKSIALEFDSKQITLTREFQKVRGDVFLCFNRHYPDLLEFKDDEPPEANVLVK